jgi:hypothetical protein
MDIQLVSFGLALLVGAITFGLVKHTTDEFDRWYTDDEYRQSALHIPPVLASVAIVGCVLILFAVVR